MDSADSPQWRRIMSKDALESPIRRKGSGTEVCIHAVSPQRWIWAASSVQKMPGGLQWAFKKAAGEKVKNFLEKGLQTASVNFVKALELWNDRFLLLCGYTNCLHWFREGSGTCLGLERGCIRLSIIGSVQVSDEDNEGWRILSLLDSAGQSLLIFRAASNVITAWERAICAGRDRAAALAPPGGIWPPVTHDGKPHVLTTIQEIGASMGSPFPVDDVLFFKDSRIKLMGFALESGNDQVCVPKFPKLCLFVVSGTGLQWFEPRDRFCFGDRRGSLDLTSLATTDLGDQHVLLVSNSCRIVMTSLDSTEWVKRLTDPALWEEGFADADFSECGDDPSSGGKVLQNLKWLAKTTVRPISVAGELAMSCLLSIGAMLVAVFVCYQKQLRAIACAGLWNMLIAAFLCLHGTWMFWVLLAGTNAVVMWKMLRSSISTSHLQQRSAGGAVSSSGTYSVPLGPHQECAEDGNATTILVRGPTYLADKVKQPSQKALFELVRMQVSGPPETGGKRFHIAAQTNMDDLDDSSLHGPLPQFFVMNMLLPEGPPKLRAAADCPCTSIAFIFRVCADTQAAASAADCKPALKLLLRYFKEGCRDPSLQSRLKVICQINPADGGVPRMLKKFDGQPAVIGKSGQVFQGKDYLEVDVDISNCSYMHRSGLHQMQATVGTLEIQVAVVIQGDRPDELPENVFACAAVHRVSLDRRPLPDDSDAGSPMSSQPGSPVLSREEGSWSQMTSKLHSSSSLGLHRRAT